MGSPSKEETIYNELKKSLENKEISPEELKLMLEMD